MAKLRLTKYGLFPSPTGTQWEKIADYYVEDDGTPSVIVSPRIRESEAHTTAVAEAGIPGREPVYSDGLGRDVPFIDGEGYLQALSEMKSTYTRWEWHDDTGLSEAQPGDVQPEQR